MDAGTARRQTKTLLKSNVCSAKMTRDTNAVDVAEKVRVRVRV